VSKVRGDGRSVPSFLSPWEDFSGGDHETAWTELGRGELIVMDWLEGWMDDVM
jgi:hypothetical protein